MSIAAAIAAETAPRYCKFGEILTVLAPDDLQAIIDGSKNGLTHAATSRILTDNGHPVSEKVVQRHANDKCRCKDAA